MGARHHLVPQFYLRHFADDSSQVRLVSRDDFTQSHDSSVRKAVTEVGYYRIETEDLERSEDRETHDPELVETRLAQLEASIAPVIKKIVERRSFEFANQADVNDAWYRLIQFTALQSVRGPRWRTDFDALLNHSVRVQILSDTDDERLRESLAQMGRPHSPGAVEDFRRELFEGPFPKLVVPKAVMVQQSLRMALGDPDSGQVGLAQYLATKRPTLVRPTTTSVLTGDEPVCWWAPGDEPVGFATAEVIWVPLSPDLILQFIDPDRDVRDLGLPDPRSHDGADELARFVNEQVARQSERWVVHHPRDTPLAGIDTMPRSEWGAVLVSLDESGGERRAVYVHRRIG